MFFDDPNASSVEKVEREDRIPLNEICHRASWMRPMLYEIGDVNRDTENGVAAGGDIGLLS